MSASTRWRCPPTCRTSPRRRGEKDSEAIGLDGVRPTQQIDTGCDVAPLVAATELEPALVGLYRVRKSKACSTMYENSVWRCLLATVQAPFHRSWRSSR